jgi:Ca2+-binding EF-hand superfamily protein
MWTIAAAAVAAVFLGVGPAEAQGNPGGNQQHPHAGGPQAGGQQGGGQARGRRGPQGQGQRQGQGQNGRRQRRPSPGKIFRRFDQNNDGYIDQAEAGRAWQRLQNADVDGDGKVSRQELQQHLAGTASDKAFDRLDKDNNDILDATEIQNSRNAQRILAADTDSDGQVTRAEWDAQVQSRVANAQQVQADFQTADGDSNGKLDATEWPATANASFADVDADSDGEVTPREVMRWMGANNGQSPF